MAIFNTDEKRIATLENVEGSLLECMNLNTPQELTKKANIILQCLSDLNGVVKSSSIPFKGKCMLSNELYYYKKKIIPILDCFCGRMKYIPFDSIEYVSYWLFDNKYNMIDYEDDIKVGNEAIGQAWLSDGIEVFSPRHAINHTLNATIMRWYASTTEYKKDFILQTKEVTAHVF